MKERNDDADELVAERLLKLADDDTSPAAEDTVSQVLNTVS